MGDGIHIPTVLDWNRDGFFDIIVWMYGSMSAPRNDWYLFLRQPDGRLLPHPNPKILEILTTTFLQDPFPGHVQSVDWDFDGDPDLVFFAQIGIFLFERVGDELAPPEAILPSPAVGAFCGDVVDWDDDGDWDLVIFPAGSPRLVLALQEKHQFRIVSDDENPFHGLWIMPGPCGLDFADFDGDGLLDLLFGQVSSTISLYRQVSSNTFVHQPEWDKKIVGPDFPVVVDWDADGDYEVIVGSPTGLDYWKLETCDLEHACFRDAGICHKQIGTCHCVQGHNLQDCALAAISKRPICHFSPNRFTCMGVLIL